MGLVPGMNRADEQEDHMCYKAALQEQSKQGYNSPNYATEILRR